MRKVFVFLALASLASVGFAQKTYLLRIKVKPGQVFKYRMNVKSGTTAQSMTVGLNMTMNVTGAKNNQFTIASTMGGVTLNGKPAPAAAASQLSKMKTITVMDSRANIVKSEIQGMPGAPQSPQGSSVPFPQNAIKIGATWSGKANIQGQQVETVYKLIAVKPVMGKMAAVIHATPKGIANLKTKGPIVYSVELATGFPLSMNMVGTVTQGTTTQNMSMTMQRM
jgi:hypothetical protein